MHQTRIAAATGSDDWSVVRTRFEGELLARRWAHYLFELEHAFQPIVNSHTGVCAGYEALLRGFPKLGFDDIPAVFDAAHADGQLLQLEMGLREKAISQFAALPDSIRRGRRLFLNVDNRVLALEGYGPGATARILDRYDVSPSALILEFSERHELSGHESVWHSIEAYRKDHRMRVAIDDFGRGVAGMHLLYRLEPDFIKIDKFFIQRLASDRRRRVFVTGIVGIAHLLGARVIAEGVETAEEFEACRAIGCDLIQGFLVAKPTLDRSALKQRYETVEALSSRNRRHRPADNQLIRDSMERLETVRMDAGIFEAFERFRRDKGRHYIPVIDDTGEPIGLLREQDIKEYVYSPFGRDLLSNPAYTLRLEDLVAKCPVADINTTSDALAAVFSSGAGNEGVIITEDMQYVGFLSATSLISIITEKNLNSARDQSPLTKLAGNTMIYEYVSGAMARVEETYVLIYIDLDNFKPFNDRYGFRQGDRVLLLMADILRTSNAGGDRFIGHVGGDDFFIGFRNADPEAVRGEVRDLLEKFSLDVIGFYDSRTRLTGELVALDRDGRERHFPLLTASAVLLHLPKGRELLTLDEISSRIAEAKQSAKRTPGAIVAISLLEVAQSSLDLTPC